jgi:hypothetical protein
MQTRHGLAVVRILCCAFGMFLILQTAFGRDDLSTLRGFESAFRRGNASSDVGQLERLVFWDGARRSPRIDLRRRLKEGLGQKIDKIQVLPFSTEIALFGPFLRHPTLPPTHVFVVWYRLPPDDVGVPIVGTRYPIGKNNGRFYIVVSERAPVSSIHY